MAAHAAVAGPRFPADVAQGANLAAAKDFKQFLFRHANAVAHDAVGAVVTRIEAVEAIHRRGRTPRAGKAGRIPTARVVIET
jgi:hypothetical protein